MRSERHYRDSMEIAELHTAKEIFFRNNQILDDNSRKRPVVYARTAFSAAFRRAGCVRLGKVLGRDHASVVHYLKSHKTLVQYKDYRDLYEKAIEFRKAFMEDDDLPIMSHHELIQMIQELRQELREEKERSDKLYIYKQQMENIKQML